MADVFAKYLYKLTTFLSCRKIQPCTAVISLSLTPRFDILDTVDLLGVFSTSILVYLNFFSFQLASWNELLTFGVPRFSMATGR